VCFFIENIFLQGAKINNFSKLFALYRDETSTHGNNTGEEIVVENEAFEEKKNRDQRTKTHDAVVLIVKGDGVIAPFG
jgi:hypothetical protein